MRARCPSCAAIYDLPATMLSEGRTLRCGLCATEWQADATEPEPAPADEPVPPTAMDEAAAAALPIIAPFQPAGNGVGGETDSLMADPASERLAVADGVAAVMVAPPPARSRWLAALLGWVGSLVFLVGAAGTAIGRRETLMQAWPPSQRLFHWLGFI